jgi:hypothetical protein
MFSINNRDVVCAPDPRLMCSPIALVPREPRVRAQNAVLAVRSERCFRGAHFLKVSRALASDGCEFEFAAAVDRGLVVLVLVL